MTGARQHLFTIQTLATPSLNGVGQSETEYLKLFRSTPVNSDVGRSSKSLEMRQIWTFSAHSVTIVVQATRAGQSSVAENSPGVDILVSAAMRHPRAGEDSALWHHPARVGVL